MKRFIARAVMTALWFCYFPIAILALVFLVITKELGYLMEKLWDKFENWMNE
jgi:L-asparagine transporter-like permease